MKRKTSITLSRDVLAEVDRLAGPKGSRAAVIERVLRRYLRRRAQELERLNRAAERLDAEAGDVLAYQVPWSGE